MYAFILIKKSSIYTYIITTKKYYKSFSDRDINQSTAKELFDIIFLISTSSLLFCGKYNMYGMKWL